MTINIRTLLLFCLLSCTTQPVLNATSGDCRPSISCSSKSISDDCGNGCSGAHDDCTDDANQISTFFRPRPILTDLTYRNNITFYQRYHDACCSFFSYDVTYLYQKNRHAACVGLGFFGQNPFTVAELDAKPGDINSLNLGLGSDQPGGFFSTFTFRPKRGVFAWMPSLLFNLDCFCTGLWADITTAVVNARHEFCLNEKVTTPGNITYPRGQTTVTLTNVQEAFDELRVFSDSRSHTGVDDIEVRLGYDWLYCENDHLGLYLSGIIPTGKQFDNSRLFQPLVGTRSGAAGFGLSGDCTLWDDETAQSAAVIMSELKYLFRFKHKDKRIFDLKNGPLSRFLLVAEPGDLDPISGTKLLRHCVPIKERSLLEWWLSFHYQWCGWGFELAYNLFFQDAEHIQPCRFNFDNFGIFDLTRCDNLTSHSQAKIYDGFGQGTPDEEFVPLTTKDVNFSSARAHKALSNTLSGSVSYSNIWRECYPWSVGLSVSYEFASPDHRRATLENWGVFGKWSMSI